MLCDDLEGWGVGQKVQERGDICVHAADSPHCTPETNTTLESNYTPIEKKKNRNTKKKSILRSSPSTLLPAAEDEELPKAIQYQQHFLRRVKRREKQFAGNENTQGTFLSRGPRKDTHSSHSRKTGPQHHRGARLEGLCVWKLKGRVGIDDALLFESGESRDAVSSDGNVKEMFKCILH